MTATSKSSAAAAATAGALAAATVALCYSPFCNFLARVFPKESWGPGVGVELATAYMYPIIIASLLYLPLTYGLRRYMQNRPAYSLKGVAFLWNLSLSFLSLLGFLTVLIQQPKMLVVSMHPERYFCPPVRVVITIFTLTKAVEFGDTLLLVLKKKPLSFLHLYHHLTVSLYCWHAQYINADFAHGFAIMNLAVHAVMYFYFSLTCFLTPTRKSTPASEKGCCTRLTAIQRMLYKSRPLITMLQIAQMLVGMYLSYQGIYLKDRMQVFNAQLALAMYTSYAILFLHLYCSSYLPHLSSNRVLLLLLLHMIAGLGVYKLWQESQHKLLLTLQMGVVAAVSLSLSFYSSSTNSKTNSKTNSSPRALSNSSRVLLPLTLTFNWLSGIAHAMREGETAEERERMTTQKQQTPTQTPRETKGDDAPTRCLSGTSTTAETATLSSCLSSSECIHDDTQTTPTVARTAAAPAACCCTAAGLAAAHAAPQTAAETGDINPPSPTKKRDRKEEGNNNNNKGLIYQLVKKERNFSFRWAEVAAAAAGAAAPAVYGHITNGDWGLGFCFFGALRWAIELHAADQIASYA